MNKIQFAVLGLLGLAPVAALAAPAASAPVTVNGETISPALINELEAVHTPKGQAVSPAVKQGVENELVNQRLLVQQAIRAGLDRDPAVANELALMRDNLLAKAYVDRTLKAHPITDAAARAEYDKLKSQLGGNEYKVRHILVKTRSEAEHVIAQLNRGANFDKLARADSIDPQTKSLGGELGWVNPRALINPLGAVIPQLAKGKYTREPVQLGNVGYDVIKLEDVRPVKIDSFEQVKPQMVQRLQQEEINRLLAGLRANAKITGL